MHYWSYDDNNFELKIKMLIVFASSIVCDYSVTQCSKYSISWILFVAASLFYICCYISFVFKIRLLNKIKDFGDLDDEEEDD